MAAKVNVSLFVPEKLGTIDPLIYGHFSEHIGGVIYDGIWVGENSHIPNINGFRKDLVEKFRAIKPSVLRWPGGCFAEIYNWRDGIGPKEERPIIRNWWIGDDGRYETNEFGTHEFIEFCRLVGAEPYIAANITSMTPMDIRDWIDYCNSPAGTTTMARLREKNGHKEPFNVKYWGVGNETWGGGGNMTPEVYGHEFRKYSVIMLNSASNLCLIGSGANHNDWKWARDFLNVVENSDRNMGGFSLHFYCGTQGTATEFTENQYYRLLRQAADIESAIDRNWGFVVGYGLEKHGRLVIDEWGCWHKGGSGPSADLINNNRQAAANNPNRVENLFEQQSTMRDAVVAALSLNIFNNNPEKILMTTVAQTVNNLHSLFLAGDGYMICTPTYHVFDMMKYHQGAKALRIISDAGEITYNNPENGREERIERLSLSASEKDGVITVTAANLSYNDELHFDLKAYGVKLQDVCEYELLTSDDVHHHNTPEEPEKVKLSKGILNVNDEIIIPPYSVATLRMKSI